MVDLQESFHQVLDKVRGFLKEEEEAHDPASMPSFKVKSSQEVFDPNCLYQEIPYQYQDDAELFINKKSVGFGFLLSPKAGADLTLLNSLDRLIKDKISDEVEVQCSLLSHPWIGESLEKCFEPMKSQGNIFSLLAEHAKRYHQKAAFEGYKNLRGIPAVLRDYQVYLWLSKKAPTKITKNSYELESSLGEMERLREDIEAELRTASFGFRRMDVMTFLKLIRRITTPNRETLLWDSVEYNGFETLNAQCLNKGTTWSIKERYIDVEYEETNCLGEKKVNTTRVINLGVAKMPARFKLWQSADNFCNLLHLQKGISCPFMITLQFKVLPRNVAQTYAQTKLKLAERGAGGAIGRAITGSAQKVQEWKEVNDRLNDNTISLCDMFYSVTLFSTPETAKRDRTQAEDAFAHNGIKLYCPPCLQLKHYLACLPFYNSEGLWSDLKKFKLVQRQPHSVIANFMPIVADFKGSPEGLLLPTFRNQLCFIDNFDDRHLPITNYNKLYIGAPGGGKSVVVQDSILFELSRGDQVFVIDLGESYKNFCELVGGDYIDVSSIKLNPFTLFGESESHSGELVSHDEMIRNLVAVMANPHRDLEQIAMDWLLVAVQAVRREKATPYMDDLVEVLQKIEKDRPDSRLHDLIFSLKKYCQDGLYQHLCNGNAPLLNKKRFVVLEMGSFQHRPELLKIVMFIMINLINTQFYHSPRDQRKSCYFDECWRHLEADSEVAVKLIGPGFRTARKHLGSFSVIVHSPDDLDKSRVGQTIKSCCDTQVFLRQGDFERYVNKNPDEFSAFEEILIKNFGEAKNNGFSEMMIRIGRMTSFHRLFLDPFKRVLFSSSGEEFEAIQHLKKQGLSLIEAVEKVSERYYRNAA